MNYLSYSVSRQMSRVSNIAIYQEFTSIKEEEINDGSSKMIQPAETRRSHNIQKPTIPTSRFYLSSLLIFFFFF